MAQRSQGQRRCTSQSFTLACATSRWHAQAHACVNTSSCLSLACGCSREGEHAHTNRAKREAMNFHVRAAMRKSVKTSFASPAHVYRWRGCSRDVEHARTNHAKREGTNFHMRTAMRKSVKTSFASSIYAYRWRMVADVRLNTHTPTTRKVKP